MPADIKGVKGLARIRALLAAEDSFYGRLLCASLVGVAAIALLGAILPLLAVREHQQATLRTRTLEVLRVAQQVETDLASMEANYLRFLLTKRGANLEAVAKHQPILEQRLTELGEAVNGRADTAGEVEAARTAVIRWFQALRLARVPGEKPAPRPPSSIEHAWKALRKVQAEERRLFAAQSSGDNRANLRFQVLLFIPKLSRVVSEMQKTKAAYLLSGEKEQLDSYRRAAQSFETYTAHLSVLLADLPEPLARLQEIEERVQQWQQEAVQPLLKAKANGQDVVPLLSQLPTGELLGAARASIGSFEQAEEAAYEEQAFSAWIQRMLRTVGSALLALVALGFVTASSWYSLLAYRRHLQKIATDEVQTRTIVETTLDGVITIDDQGFIQTVNPAAEKMFAFPAGALQGQTISKVIPQRLFLHDIGKLSRGTMMAVGQRQGFYPFPIEISLSEIRVGSKKRFVALIRDVTERKRSEETLKHIGVGVSSTTGEEFLRGLLKQLSETLESDTAFMIELGNCKGESGCTLSLAEQGNIRVRLNYDLTNTACEDVLQKGFQVYPKAVQEIFPHDELLRERGAESMLGMPLVDHKGRTVGIMGVIDKKPMENVQIAESTLQIFGARAGAEIERKRFEEDLEAEKERLAVTLRSIADGCITIENEGRIVLINNVAEKLTGWTQEQATGRPLADVFNVINETTRTPCGAALQRIVDTGSVASSASQTIIISLDGREGHIESSAAPMRDRWNRKIGVVLVFRDISQRLKAEEERRKAEKLESLGVAAGGIAHDFNNLLTVIIGNVSLAMMNAAPDDDGVERLRAAKKASLRAQELAQQLLTFARGGAPIKKTAEIAGLVRESAGFALAGTNSRSVYAIGESLWPVDIDCGQISQVIGNLVANAHQAMPAGGTIHIGCENFNLPSISTEYPALSPGKYMQITVADDGPGIPEENLEKIFDPYFTTKPGSSGLGLATAYSIIKNHGGAIMVDSRLGEGASFKVYLPASERALEIESAKPAVPVENVTRKARKVLVMDDEEAICTIISLALTPEGYDVAESNDAPTAIRLYKEAMDAGEKFDAVIMDLTIPGGMGGKDAVKRMLELDPSARVIVSSGYATDPVVSRYKEHGFCACISKPYELDALIQIVHDVSNGDDAVLVCHEFAKARNA